VLTLVSKNIVIGKHDRQRDLNFWNYHHKALEIHPPVAAIVSAGHHASPRVGLAPVEPLLRPWLAQTAKFASKLLQITRPPNAAAAIQPQHSNARRDNRAQTPHSASWLYYAHTKSSIGFLASPLSSDNVCNVPHRRALELNGIISYANHLTDARHATISATTYLQITRQPCPLSPHVLKKWSPFDTPDKA
jgi:hypothetical protein